MKKAIMIVAALVCVAIGIGLIYYSGDAANDAEVIAAAQQVEDGSIVDGVVAITGEAYAEYLLACPEGSSEEYCVYVATTSDVYTVTSDEVCRDPYGDELILEQTRQKCDADGNCQPCYRVQKSDWKFQGTDEQFASFEIGGYTVTGTPTTIHRDTSTADGFSGNGTTFSPLTGDTRLQYTYVPESTVVTVVGTAVDGVITSPTQDTPLFISGTDYDTLLAEVQRSDAATRWILRILGILGIIGGGVLVFLAVRRADSNSGTPGGTSAPIGGTPTV